MKAKVKQLAGLSLFSELSPQDLETLQTHIEIQTYRQGEIVVHEGDVFPEKLHIVFKGVLQVQKTAATGKETILRRLRDGDIFAAPALFGDALAPATVVVVEDCQVLRLDRAKFLSAVQETPELALRILVVFNQRLQQLHNMVHGLVSERAVVRLARLIQDTALQHGTYKTAAGEQLLIKLPYYQMARSIGITYEECARLMKGLQTAVQYRRGGKITILDQGGLEAIALGDLEP
ncbi:MAG: Crp/Fnr family transcriptional regulator [Moorea sp. SIO2B7]|nr:Crp/Fnr family transcriptional regulator [Moorena sp. SIO2B7]